MKKKTTTRVNPIAPCTTVLGVTAVATILISALILLSLWANHLEVVSALEDLLIGCLVAFVVIFPTTVILTDRQRTRHQADYWRSKWSTHEKDAPFTLLRASDPVTPEQLVRPVDATVCKSDVDLLRPEDIPSSVPTVHETGEPQTRQF